MEMSNAFESLLKQVNAVGAEKLDGYDINVLDKVFDFERDKAEDLIWNTFFKRKDVDIAVLFPKLKKYNGIQALKDAVKKYKIPSSANMLLAFLIYENTKEIEYLKLMEKNIVESQYNSSYVAMIIYLPPCEAIYQTLKKIYLNCSERIACGSAINGILYNKGFIKDINNLEDISNVKELKIILKKGQMQERPLILKELESGMFDIYKTDDISK